VIFHGLDLTGVKLKKYIESSAISPNGKRIAVAGRGDILLFLLKRRCKKYF
jgi:hypothetical protein